MKKVLSKRQIRDIKELTIRLAIGQLGKPGLKNLLKAIEDKDIKILTDGMISLPTGDNLENLRVLC